MKKATVIIIIIVAFVESTQTQNVKFTNINSANTLHQSFFEQQTDSIKKVVGGVEIMQNTTGNILQIKSSSIFVNSIATITNQQGKVLKQFMLTGTNQKIDITNLPNGIYYLKTIDGVDKFIRQ